MTPTTFVQASTTLLAQLASPAARALTLAAAAGLGLATFRVKATNVRLVTWTAVLYAALAMPLLGWMLPSLPVPTPSFVRSALQSVRQNRIFATTAEPSLPAAATERPRNAAYASRGTARITDEPQRGERLTLAQASTLAAAGVHASPSPSPSEMPTTDAPAVTAATSKLFPAIPWSSIAAGTYLAVAFFLLVRFLVGLAFGRRLLHASQTIDDPHVTTRLASRAHSSGLAFVPPAAESEFISVPVTMGALRSTILLPTAWREWDDAKLDAVVAHEVSHVARRDALTQRLSLLHRAIFWFSPLAWWLDRHLANLAEQASDEAALSCGADRKRYATTLLEFFEALQAAPGRVWWQGVSMAKAGQAEKRVERILSWKGTVTMGFTKSGFKKSIAVAAVALAVPVVYLAASARPAGSNGSPQNVSLAQNQTPPPAPSPAPQAQPSSAPAPAVAPAQEMTSPPEPAAQLDPATAPPAIAGTVGGGPVTGTITGTIRGGIASVPPRPGVAPVAPIAPQGTPPDATVRPVAPVAAIAPPSPLAILT
ncbi:MAG: M56 family metallopeptidase, partial [Candidatus Sulfotelmatobacter sp.]